MIIGVLSRIQVPDKLHLAHTEVGCLGCREA